MPFLHIAIPMGRLKVTLVSLVTALPSVEPNENTCSETRHCPWTTMLKTWNSPADVFPNTLVTFADVFMNVKMGLQSYQHIRSHQVHGHRDTC